MTSFFTKSFHLINFPPLLSLTIFFIIGIIFHTIFTQFLIIFLLILCSFLFTHFKQTSLPKHLLPYAFFTLAGAWLHHKELGDYDTFYTWINHQKITVTGTVIDSAETVINHKKTTAITVLADIVATKNITQKCNKLFVFYTKSNKNLEVGDTAAFYDVHCKKPASKDFQRYQMKEQIIATIFDDAVTCEQKHHPPYSLRNWLWNQKKRLLDGLKNKLSPECFRFFSSLFLGNRACIKNELEETNEQFKTWGISHFLARSGLHLVLFIFIWQTLFCIIPLPLLIKQIIIFLISCIYFILTWTSAPFTRSFALFAFNKICLFGRIPFHLLHYLTLVCFLFLLYCPLYVFFLDFQLSFALTFALAWLNQVTAEHKKI